MTASTRRERESASRTNTGEARPNPVRLGRALALSGLVFLSAFAGAAAAVLVVYQVAHMRTILLPGALLLGGVVVNITSGAGVLIIQYLTEYTRALQILRWMVGSLDV